MDGWMIDGWMDSWVHRWMDGHWGDGLALHFRKADKALPLRESPEVFTSSCSLGVRCLLLSSGLLVQP